MLLRGQLEALDGIFDGENAAETWKEKTVVLKAENKQLPYDKVQVLYEKYPLPKRPTKRQLWAGNSVLAEEGTLV